MDVAPLPENVAALCVSLNAPARLVAHLQLVHDTATKLLDAFEKAWPVLPIDKASVLIGAATHDLGKVLHSNELTSPGNLHELDGPPLLVQHGFSAELARFARTHAQWDDTNARIEDLIVALADSVWKGARREKLEAQILKEICAVSAAEPWEVFQKLDRIVSHIAKDAPARLEWQRRQA